MAPISLNTDTPAALAVKKLTEHIVFSVIIPTYLLCVLNKKKKKFGGSWKLRLLTVSVRCSPTLLNPYFVFSLQEGHRQESIQHR